MARTYTQPRDQDQIQAIVMEISNIHDKVDSTSKGAHMLAEGQEELESRLGDKMTKEQVKRCIEEHEASGKALTVSKGDLTALEKRLNQKTDATAENIASLDEQQARVKKYYNEKKLEHRSDLVKAMKKVDAELGTKIKALLKAEAANVEKIAKLETQLNDQSRQIAQIADVQRDAQRDTAEQQVGVGQQKKQVDRNAAAIKANQKDIRLNLDNTTRLLHQVGQQNKGTTSRQGYANNTAPEPGFTSSSTFGTSFQKKSLKATKGSAAAGPGSSAVAVTLHMPDAVDVFGGKIPKSAMDTLRNAKAGDTLTAKHFQNNMQRPRNYHRNKTAEDIVEEGKQFVRGGRNIPIMVPLLMKQHHRDEMEVQAYLVRLQDWAKEVKEGDEAGLCANGCPMDQPGAFKCLRLGKANAYAGATLYSVCSNPACQKDIFYFVRAKTALQQLPELVVSQPAVASQPADDEEDDGENTERQGLEDGEVTNSDNESSYSSSLLSSGDEDEDEGATDSPIMQSGHRGHLKRRVSRTKPQNESDVLATEADDLQRARKKVKTTKGKGTKGKRI
eukprot:gene24862-7120_t